MLKNAIDWVYPERHRKAACFVSYGSTGGARSVQQLRQTVIELQLAPIRSSVHNPVATLWAHYQGGDVDAGLAELDAPAGAMIDDLLWWTAALKAARASASRPATARRWPCSRAIFIGTPNDPCPSQITNAEPSAGGRAADRWANAWPH